MERFTIRVFGIDDYFGDASENGGWALHSVCTSFERAEEVLYDLLREYGWNDVLWDWDSVVARDFEPEEDFEDDYDECGFNPYMGCYDYDC